jgi:hypothetical protein
MRRRDFEGLDLSDRRAICRATRTVGFECDQVVVPQIVSIHASGSHTIRGVTDRLMSMMGHSRGIDGEYTDYDMTCVQS